MFMSALIGLGFVPTQLSCLGSLESGHVHVRTTKTQLINQSHNWLTTRSLHIDLASRHDLAYFVVVACNSLRFAKKPDHCSLLNEVALLGSNLSVVGLLCDNCCLWERACVR